MTTDEAQLTSGRMDPSVQSIPVLLIPGTHVQSGSVQQFINFGSVQAKLVVPFPETNQLWKH